MKRVLSASQLRRFKIMSSVFLFTVFSCVTVNIGVAQLEPYHEAYAWQGNEFKDFMRTEYTHGYVDEYTSNWAGFCHR